MAIECPYCHVSRSERFLHEVIDSRWFHSNYRCANPECRKIFGSQSSIISRLKTASSVIGTVVGAIKIYEWASETDDQSSSTDPSLSSDSDSSAGS